MASELWAGVGSALAFLLALVTVAFNHVKIKLLINNITSYFNQYKQITIPEYGAECFQRSDFFVTIEAYLSESCAHGARKLRAELGSDKKKPEISVDDEQEIKDTYGGATLWWYAVTELPSSNVISFQPTDEKRRFYRVTFHRRFHNHIVESYLPQIIEKGRAIIAKNRQRRLFTNNPSSRWSSYQERKTIWSHVEFQHPATFDTLAMDPTEKASIVDDLRAFTGGKDYYTRVGKAWKRGYLLFGPPGTGKSTMIAAMANFLDYDVNDLELTAVKNNTELRKLFIETKEKSIIVIEDIDCSLDLTAKRQDKKAHKESGDDTKTEKKEDEDDTKLTLSGVLNFIDGLWSACGGERIIIFTTNNKGALDPALIRPGRMDKHIEMSYCRYEAFKVLAHNYLDITEHQLFELFGEIQELLEHVNMSPADVAGYLMRTEKRDASVCLEGLVVALKILKAKEDAAVEAK
ncbi:AAA-ATPase ASD, mitochondrial-like [Miscanthus floridulus]|uniref:AAA-ATPase ASD, mitochondrial-like n=1 Tax=Miscanthus floridulus TaxID=154761 RepID=UPI0034574842